LIANDDPLQLAILEAIFEKNKFKVTTAINGQQAYEAALKSKHHPSLIFDLIVLDLQMPVCDGFEACRNIKKMFSDKVVQEDGAVEEVKSYNKNRRESNFVLMDLMDFMPHIIAVSGYVDEDVRADAGQAGFDAIFSVPLTFKDVKNEIMPVLIIREQKLSKMNSIANMYKS
jgi:CheY-like chemotaxis protein